MDRRAFKAAGGRERIALSPNRSPVPLEIPDIEEPKDDPDAHGQAALLLVESLIHGLIARSVLSVADGVEVMEVAFDAQVAITDGAARPTSSMQRVTTLLGLLLDSLKTDL